MAASAILSGDNKSNNQQNGNGATSNGNGTSAPATDKAVVRVGPTGAVLRHNPGLSLDWTPDEQALLEELLTKYASESIIRRYARIAKHLNDKTVRDVALRCRWMTKKENGKRRKEDHNSARKNKDRKEKGADPMAKLPHATIHSDGPSYAQSVISMGSDDGISYEAIGGATGKLLEQNAQALDQISANFTAFKINENFNLFHQARNNILSILNDLNDLPEVMKQMPPLPVKLNEELATSVLSHPPLQS